MIQQQPVQNQNAMTQGTVAMTDKEFITQALSTEKYMSHGYGVALNEMSHQQLFSCVDTIARETQACQRSLYTLMFQKGWYSLTPANQADIAKAVQQYSQEKQQFPNA
ncbi:spore coat protein [Aureibacillus halotolerans]|uniref:Coat F domain-containing protein n=1 Tax=Aureibacillus halotolerans TaxID=1508390 RepID=A0A4R6UBL1_9BACI|nr:spore coat protein [Aureibacillus halotolerans]TDQ40474.1 coat F domain-containing protein [Aureibacillus halotolerans]